MTKKKTSSKELSVEALFPNAAGRKAADDAIDKLPVTASMATYLDLWEAIYFNKVGKSPFRKKEF